MHQKILCLPPSTFPDLPDKGFWTVDGFPDSFSFCSRAEVEHDSRWLQLIPYLLLIDDQRRIWCYRRSGGDRRLTNRYSCGIGGHIETRDLGSDLATTILNCLHREADEELKNPEFSLESRPLCWLYEAESEIGRCHIGMVFVGHWQAAELPAATRSEGIEAIGFLSPDRIMHQQSFELWSRLAARQFMEVYNG